MKGKHKEERESIGKRKGRGRDLSERRNRVKGLRRRDGEKRR
jgi:hypothetical protein